MLRLFSVLLFLVISFSGCTKNDPEISSLKGTYAGTFYYRSLSASGSGNTSIIFAGNTYGCTGNSNRIPAGGSGNYNIVNQEIQFKDINYWTTDFDYGLVLNGNYTYQTKNDSLILIKATTTSLYQYRLKRTN